MENQQLYIVLFLTMFALNIVEVVLRRGWMKLYYVIGLSLFKKKFMYLGEFKSGILASDLNGTYLSSSDVQIVFHEIDDTTIGFRENFKLFQFQFGRNTQKNNTPIMHGVIQFKQNENSIIVNGYANWSALAFLPFWYTMLYYMQIQKNEELGLFRLIFLIAPPLIFLFIYYKQTKTYLEIVNHLKNELNITSTET